MPSYYRNKPKKYKTRYEIMSALREKTLRRQKLEEIFDRTIGKFLTAPRSKEVGVGYSQEVVSMPEQQFSKRRFAQLLYDLKKDGLILEKTDQGGRLIYLTARGIEWLKEYGRKPHPVSYTPAAKGGERVTIVSYDIPEKMRLYREWLRQTLRTMKFNKIQQSVWIGKVQLPTDFLSDLVRFRLDKHVEIFEITKTGTLRPRL